MKSFALAALWVLASIGAVSVAWAGVSVVDSQVITPAPATVAPALEGVGLEDEAGIDTSLSIEKTEGAPPSSVQSSTSTVALPTTKTSPDPSTSASAASSTTITTATSAPSTTVPPGSSTTMPTTTSTTVPAATTTQPPAEAETLMFNLTGGTTAISFSATGVKVLWATANSGFDVTIEPESPGWKVEFRSDDHRSRIDAWWDDGPVTDIEERDT